MKKILIIVIIISVILSLFSSCRKNEDDDVNSQFVQRVYDISSVFSENTEGVSKIVYSDTDKNYYVSFMSKITVYDENFEYVRTIKGDIAGISINFFTTRFDIDEDNNIYIISQIDKKWVLIVFDNDGKFIEEIEIADLKEIQTQVNDLWVTENNYVLAYPTGIQIIDKKGKTIREITIAGGIISTNTDKSNSIYISTGRGGLLTKINISDGKEVWSVNASRGGNLIGKISYSHENNQICVSIDNFLLLYDTNGSYLGEICDLRDFKLPSNDFGIYNYADGLMVNYLFYRSIESIALSLTAYQQQGEFTLKLKALNEEESAKILEEREEQKNSKSTIKIFVPIYNISLERMIYEFNNTNPNIYVEMEYYKQNPGLFNISDYVQYISMRINAGEDNWDILSNVYLPYDIYQARGYVADIDKIDTDGVFKNSELYFTNIIDAIRDKSDGFYSFPIEVGFPALESLKQPLNRELSSIQNLLEEVISLNNNGKPVFYDMIYSESFNIINYTIFCYLYPEFVSTQHGNIFFNKEKFYQFLDIIEKLSANADYTNERENADFTISYIVDFFLAAGYDKRYSLNILPINIDDSVNKRYAFSFNGYMIWSKSTIQKEALEFLEYISDNNNFFGISRADFNRQVEAYRNGLPSDIINSRPEAVEETEKFIQDITKIYESLNFALMPVNPDLGKFWLDYYNKYFEESSITKEALAQIIEDFLWLYENESR